MLSKGDSSGFQGDVPAVACSHAKLQASTYSSSNNMTQRTVATKFSGEMTGLKVAKLVGGSEEEARL
jgi:hypothetical protein